MAVLLTSLFLTLVIHIKADGCFERFGSDEAKCKETQGKCEWLEKDGEGKCVMPAKKDGCFERFGSHKANCTATNGRCRWVEKHGKGKCVMPMRPKQGRRPEDGCFERFGTNKDKCMNSEGKCEWLEKDGEGKCVMPAKKDGCFERFGSHKAKCTATSGRCLWVEKDGKGKCVMPMRPKHGRKVVGVLAISISSSLASVEVRETLLDQHHFLLESAVAHCRGYWNVTILGVDFARRLREAISTQLRVRFEAEEEEADISSGEAVHSQGELERVLQQSFEKAGLDFEVQSAAVVITSSEVYTSSSQGGEPDGFSKLAVGLVAIGLVSACTCTAMICMWRRWSARSPATKACGDNSAENDLVVVSVVDNAIKEKNLSETDVDIASISTGTPSTHDDFEP